MVDTDGKERFFEKSFLLANVKPEIVLKVPFLTMSNVDVDFQAWNLQWRSYTTGDVLLTTRRVKLIGKKEFAAAALDLKHEVFVVHVNALSIDLGNEVHPSKKVQVAYFKVDEAFIEVPNKYADFVNIFSLKLAAKLLKHTEINDHAIE